MRILFSVGLGAITLIILTLIVNPVEFDFTFTGLFAGNKTLNDTEPVLESLAETTSTTTVVTTTSTSTTSVVTTTPATTTSPRTTTSTTTITTVPIADHVLFSEIFYDTPGEETEEEWVELYNPTEDSVDISGLTIEDNADTYTIPNGTIIASEDYLIIARDETGFEDLYGYLPDLSDLPLGLNNGGDYLELKNGSEEIDMVAWEEGVSGWNLEADEDESIQRHPVDQDTDTDDDWRTQTTPDPDTGGLITTSTSTTTTPTTTESTTTTTTTTTTTPILEDLSVFVTVAIDPIVRGNEQTIITKVTDGTNPIEHASVNVTVKYVGPTEKKFGGFTNSSGIFDCSWTIGATASPGIFTVDSTANKEGYNSGIGSTTFNVTES